VKLDNFSNDEAFTVGETVDGGTGSGDRRGFISSPPPRCSTRAST
jgi:hypothetical protein